MKIILTLSTLILFFSTTTFAAATIRCESTPGEFVSAVAGQDLEDFRELCETEFFTGKVCFKGKRSEVLALLAIMNEEEILGDEYQIINAWYLGKNQIKYDIYDGPNEVVSTENVISRCK